MVAAAKTPIDVDHVMASIRENLRSRRKAGQRGPSATGALERVFSLALKHASPTDSDSRVYELVTTRMAKLFLRLAHFIDRWSETTGG